ncbi:MAG: flavin reductase family protein [Chloroflexota bacterium]|nr:flavin reductase family protein [Chloroflexota bacterium]MED6296607.1 flavin reductase family protein [Chloroflexota bacterium]
MSNADLFRQAWGNFATGVSLITTVEGDGSVHGMTANGIASVSLDPMLAMVCVGHSAKTFPILKQSGRFGINILTEDQKPIGEYYAKSDNSDDDKSPASFKLTRSGIPFLIGSLASMDCHVVNAHVEGDHTVFIGQVSEIEVTKGSPLLFYGGKWMTLNQ